MSAPLSVDVRELMLAIREALDVPHPDSRTAEARTARLELIEARVAHMCGSLASFNGPSDRTVLDVVAAMRRVAEMNPVTYEPFGGDRRCRACGHLICGEGDGPCGAILPATSLDLKRCQCTEGGGPR